MPRGRTRLRLAGDWGNDFGLRRRGVGDARELVYVVDGEHRSASLEVGHGLTERLTLHARLPLLWRGGGVLDGLIDGWHDLLGLPGGGRSLFPRNQLRVAALRRSRHDFEWTGTGGSGLGNLELAAQWTLRRPESPAGWTASALGRVQLPTATDPFGGGGAQAGAQVLAARGLWSSGDLYLGLGGTLAASGEHQGVRYERARAHGFLALEWRPWRAVSVVAEAAAAGRLLRNIEGFQGFHLVLKVGAKVDVAEGWRLEGGFTEGLRHISNTTDFGVMAGVEREF